MHIGLVIYGSLNTVSGGYLYDRKLVEHLQTNGETVEVVSMPWRGYADHLFDNWLSQFHQRLKALQVDLLLQDELNHPSLFWLNRRIATEVKYPIVSIVHHLRCSESHPAAAMGLYRWVEKRYLKSVDAFIFNSHTTQKTVEMLIGERALAERPGLVAQPAANHLPAPSAAVPHNYIPLRCKAHGPLRLLFVGNVIERKGVHLLLHALEKLPRESYQLDVVGNLSVDAEYVARLRDQVFKSGLQNQVTFIGTVTDEALVNYYMNAHVLVVPSYEGFGIVYLEAMQFGLPAIGLMAGAAHEVIVHAKNGFLTAPGDHASLAHHLETLHIDRTLLEQMSINALQSYAQHPTWAESGESIREWLHAVQASFSASQRSGR